MTKSVIIRVKQPPHCCGFASLTSHRGPGKSCIQGPSWPSEQPALHGPGMALPHPGCLSFSSLPRALLVLGNSLVCGLPQNYHCKTQEFNLY